MSACGDLGLITIQSLRSKEPHKRRLSMHSFPDLIDISANFTLAAFNDAQNKITEHLHNHADTSSIKALQMITLSKSIMAVGIYSLFESILQGRIGVSNGFHETISILDEQSEHALKDRFEIYYLAVNVLKHGRGRSYEALISRHGTLPFRLKLPNESFFFEGDVSEVSTLVQVNDAFVVGCAEVIRDVSHVIERTRPGCFI
jgi:hypothetical protein